MSASLQAVAGATGRTEKQIKEALAAKASFKEMQNVCRETLELLRKRAGVSNVYYLLHRS